MDEILMAENQEDGDDVNLKYSHEDVCRLFLCGLCPHQLFLSTKRDMGPCLKVHSLRLRKEYEEANLDGVVNYVQQLEYVILKLLAECYGYLPIIHGFLQDKDVTEIPVLKVTQTPEVMALAKQIKNKLKEADEFDLEGKTDLKIRALEEVEELRTKRADEESMLLLDYVSKVRASISQLSNHPPSGPQPILAPHVCTPEEKPEEIEDPCYPGDEIMGDEAHRVSEEPVMGSTEYTDPDSQIMNLKLPPACDICGEILDFNCSSFSDHFRQKLHLGYMQIREKLAQLQEESCREEQMNKKRKVDGGRSYERSNGTMAYIPRRRFTFEPYRWYYKVDAAFCSSTKNQVYVFMGKQYAVLDYVDHKVITTKALTHSHYICCGFRSLRGRRFACRGIDCALWCKGTDEAFLFSSDECVKINFAPDTSGGDYIVEDHDVTESMFPCLKGKEFEFLDAAFESSLDGQAYVFSGNRYALISYGPKRELIATGTIAEGFPCLKNTIFVNGIGAAFTSHRTNDVYLFKDKYYALLSFTPGSADYQIIDGVKETLPNWPCLRQILPRPNPGMGICPCADDDKGDDVDYDDERHYLY